MKEWFLLALLNERKQTKNRPFIKKEQYECGQKMLNLVQLTQIGRELGGMISCTRHMSKPRKHATS